MGIGWSSRSTGSDTEAWLKRMRRDVITPILERAGAQGVSALQAATPVESGLTAASWSYEIINSATEKAIIWNNSNVEDGRPVAILLQYGHGTGTGGYVEGQDYINPALRPIFDQIAADVWKAVTAR